MQNNPSVQKAAWNEMRRARMRETGNLDKMTRGKKGRKTGEREKYKGGVQDF